MVVARNVPAVFIESTINPRTIQAVIDAGAGRGHPVALGPQLYSDAMGEAGTAASTYIGMIHANTQAIVTALGGTPVSLPGALFAWAERWDVAVAGRVIHATKMAGKHCVLPPPQPLGRAQGPPDLSLIRPKPTRGEGVSVAGAGRGIR